MATAPWHIWPDLHLVLNYFKVYRSDRCLFLEAFRATQADAIPCFVSRDIIYWNLLSLYVVSWWFYTPKRFLRAWNKTVLIHPYSPAPNTSELGPLKVSKQGVEYMISSYCPSDDRGGGTVYLGWWLDTEGVGWQTQFCMQHTQP